MIFTARKLHELHDLHRFQYENFKGIDIQSVAKFPHESTTARKLLTFLPSHPEAPGLFYFAIDKNDLMLEFCPKFLISLVFYSMSRSKTNSNAQSHGITDHPQG